VRNWGVGPGFGWDYGVGLFLSEGDEDSLAADWASGRGDVNGHGLLDLRGKDNRLALSQMGTGALKRGAPSYGLAVVSGSGNLFLPAPPDAWGSVQGEGLTAQAQLQPFAADWPTVERETTAARDRERLQRRLAASATLPPEQRLESWLGILTDEGLDRSAAAQVVLAMLRLPPDEGAMLLRLADPDRFDEFIWQRIFLTAFGRRAAQAARQELKTSSGMRKALLLRILAGMPAGEAEAAGREALSDDDWRVRRAGADVLGSLFDREEGEEPGRMRLLETSAAVCRSTSTDALLTRLGSKYVWDLLSVLALDAGAPAEDKVRVFFRSGSPLDRLGQGSEGLQEFVRALQARAAAYGPAIAGEIDESARLEGSARSALLAALQDHEPEVAQAALLALGALGHPEDAPRIASFLGHDRALLREAAAAALGKMGAGAAGEIRSRLKAGSSRTRSLAALAAAQSSSPDALRLLAAAFADPEPRVRRTAIAGLFAVQSPLQPLRKEFLAVLRRLAQADPDAGIRFAAEQAAGLLSP
jgi:HEAT repeat protein